MPGPKDDIYVPPPKKVPPVPIPKVGGVAGGAVGAPHPLPPPKPRRPSLAGTASGRMGAGPTAPPTPPDFLSRAMGQVPQFNFGQPGATNFLNETFPQPSTVGPTLPPDTGFGPLPGPPARPITGTAGVGGVGEKDLGPVLNQIRDISQAPEKFIEDVAASTGPAHEAQPIEANLGYQYYLAGAGLPPATEEILSSGIADTAALNAILYQFGINALNQVAKIPERLLIYPYVVTSGNIQMAGVNDPVEYWLKLASGEEKPQVYNPQTGTWGYWNMTLDKGFVFMTPEELAAYEQPSSEELIARGGMGAEMMKNPATARYYDMNRIMHNPDGSVNWDLVFGYYDYKLGLAESIITWTGASGLAVTFALHPDRLDKFIEGVDQDKSVSELVLGLEDVWAEAAFNIATDPLLWADVFSGMAVRAGTLAPKFANIGMNVSDVFFPAGILVRKGAEFAISRVFRAGYTASGALLRKAYKESPGARNFFFGISKRSQLLAYSNSVDDAIRTLVIRHADAGMAPVDFFQKLMLGDEDALMSVGLQQRKQLLDAFALLNDTVGLNVRDILEKYGSLKGATPVIDALLKGEGNAGTLGRFIVQAVSDQYSRELGVKPLSKGSLARTLSWTSRLAREQWLGLNPRYMMNNFLDNMMKSIVSGYAPTFDVGAHTKIAKYLEEAYGTAIPVNINRTVVIDALDVADHLATADLPWPIGSPEGVGQFYKFLTGKALSEGTTKWLEGNSIFAKAMRKGNYSALLGKGFEFSSTVEQAARATIFIQAFESELLLNVRPTLAKAVLSDPNAPQELIKWIMDGRIKSPADFDKFLARYVPTNPLKSIPSINIADLSPNGIPHNAFFDAVREELEVRQAMYPDEWHLPQFQQSIDGALDQAKIAAQQIADDSLRAVEEASELPEEAFNRMRFEGEAGAAELYKDMTTGRPTKGVVLTIDEIDQLLRGGNPTGQLGFSVVPDDTFVNEALLKAQAGITTGNVVFDVLFENSNDPVALATWLLQKNAREVTAIAVDNYNQMVRLPRGLQPIGIAERIQGAIEGGMPPQVTDLLGPMGPERPPSGELISQQKRDLGGVQPTSANPLGLPEREIADMGIPVDIPPELLAPEALPNRWTGSWATAEQIAEDPGLAVTAATDIASEGGIASLITDYPDSYIAVIGYDDVGLFAGKGVQAHFQLAEEVEKQLGKKLPNWDRQAWYVGAGAKTNDFGVAVMGIDTPNDVAGTAQRLIEAGFDPNLPTFVAGEPVTIGELPKQTLGEIFAGGRRTTTELGVVIPNGITTGDTWIENGVLKYYSFTREVLTGDEALQTSIPAWVTDELANLNPGAVDKLRKRVLLRVLKNDEFPTLSWFEQRQFVGKAFEDIGKLVEPDSYEWVKKLVPDIGELRAPAPGENLGNLVVQETTRIADIPLSGVSGKAVARFDEGTGRLIDIISETPDPVMAQELLDMGFASDLRLKDSKTWATVALDTYVNGFPVKIGAYDMRMPYEQLRGTFVADWNKARGVQLNNAIQDMVSGNEIAITYDGPSGRISIGDTHDNALREIYPNLPKDEMIITAGGILDVHEFTLYKNGGGDVEMTWYSTGGDLPPEYIMNQMLKSGLPENLSIVARPWGGGPYTELGTLWDVANVSMPAHAVPRVIQKMDSETGKIRVFNQVVALDTIRIEPEMRFAITNREGFIIIGDPGQPHFKMQMERYGDPENWITVQKITNEEGTMYTFFPFDDDAKAYLANTKNMEWFQQLIRDLHLGPDEVFGLVDEEHTLRGLTSFLDPSRIDMEEFVAQLAGRYDSSEWGISPGLVYDASTGRIASGKVHEAALRKLGIRWGENEDNLVFMRLFREGEGYVPGSGPGLYIVDYAPYNENNTKQAIRRLMDAGLPGDTPIYNEMDVNIGMAKDFAGGFVKLDASGEMIDINELLGRYNPYTKEQLVDALVPTDRRSFDELTYLDNQGEYDLETEAGLRKLQEDIRAYYMTMDLEDLEDMADGQLLFERQNAPQNLQRTTGVFDFRQEKWVFDIGGDHWSTANKNNMGVDIQLVRNPADNKVYLNVDADDGDNALRLGAKKLIDLGADPNIQVNVSGTNTLDGDTTLGQLAGAWYGGGPVSVFREQPTLVNDFWDAINDLTPEQKASDNKIYVAYDPDTGLVGFGTAPMGAQQQVQIAGGLARAPTFAYDLELQAFYAYDKLTPEQAAQFADKLVKSGFLPESFSIADEEGELVGTLGDLASFYKPGAAGGGAAGMAGRIPVVEADERGMMLVDEAMTLNTSVTLVIDHNIGFAGVGLDESEALEHLVSKLRPKPGGGFFNEEAFRMNDFTVVTIKGDIATIDSYGKMEAADIADRLFDGYGLRDVRVQTNNGNNLGTVEEIVEAAQKMRGAGAQMAEMQAAADAQIAIADQMAKIQKLVNAWEIQDSNTMGDTMANVFKAKVNGRGAGDGQLLGVFVPGNPEIEGDTGKLVWSVKAPMHQPLKMVATEGMDLTPQEMFAYPNLVVGFMKGDLWISAADDVTARQFGSKLLEMGAEPTVPMSISVGDGEAQWLTLGEFLGMGMNEADTTTTVIKEMWDAAKTDWRLAATERIQNETQQTLALLDEWKAKADEAISMGQITRKAAVADREAFTASVNGFKSQWVDGLEQASMKATGEVNRVLFDYSVRNNLEELLRYYAPFTTWQLRNPFFWAQALTAHPSIINVLAQYRQASEIERKRRGLSTRFSNTIGFDVPPGTFIPAGYYAVKPSAIFSLAGQMQPTFEPPSDFEAQGANKYLQWLVQAGQSMGITPWPWISAGLEKIGAMAPGSTQLSIGPQQRAVELGLQAAGMRQPGEGLFGYTPTSKFLTDYYINRRLSEMEAEGSLTHAQALAALKNPDDPNFKLAKAWVNKYTLAMGTQGLFNPFNVKYASEGETTIRGLKGAEQLMGLTGQDRTNAELQFPYMQTYGLSMGTDQQLAYARLNAKYNTQFAGLQPWDDEYKQLAAARAAEVDAMFVKSENAGLTREQITANYIAQPLPEITDASGAKVRDTAGVLDRLRDVEPRAGDFMGAGGTIDWDTYNSALETWLDDVPQLSGQFGMGVPTKDYLLFKYRGATPERIAYDLYKNWRDDAWDYYESIKPSGDNFRTTLDWAVEQQYLKDIAAGFTPTEAQTLRTDNVVKWGLDGIPYEYTSKLLEDLTGLQPLTNFADSVRELMGLDPGQIGDVYRSLDYTLPGMFGTPDTMELARSNIQDYYYNLTPKEKTQVREFLELPEGETFLKDMTDVDVLKAWQKVSAQMFTQTYGAVVGDMSGPMMAIPMKNDLTEQEKEDLNRVRVDWFHYNESLANDKTPRWTDLMSKYYGNEDSAQSKFWAAISSYVLAGAAFDDPYLSPILNKMARTDLKYSEEQYAAALQHFLDYKQYLIDPEKSKVFQEHPEWLPLSQAEQDKFGEWKSTDMEMWKAAYNLIPWDYKLVARTKWQKQNPEIWQQLELYMLLSDAEKIKYPYYMYFYDHKDYDKYFGKKLPNQIDPEQAAAKSEKQAKAAWDYVQRKYKLSKQGIEADYTQAMTDVYGPTEMQKVDWDRQVQTIFNDHRSMVLLLMNYYAMDETERGKWKGDQKHFLEYQALLYYWKLPAAQRNLVWADVR